MTNVYLIEGARSPFGAFGGSLKDIDPTELGIAVSKEAIRRSNIRAEDIDVSVLGNVIHSGKKTRRTLQGILHCKQDCRYPVLHLR